MTKVTETIADIENEIKKNAEIEGIYEVKQFGTTLEWVKIKKHAENIFHALQLYGQLWKIQGITKTLIMEKVHGQLKRYD